MEKQELHDILSNDPFDSEEPTQYETYLYTVMKLVWANIHALTDQMERLGAHIKEHERMHQVASSEAFSMPSASKTEKVN